MIFVINGVFWRTPSSTSEDIRLPGKNIMLFLNGTQTDPSAKPAPVKKIQLTKLEDIRREPPSPVSDQVVYQPETEVVTAEEETSLPEIILADASLDIPLEIEDLREPEPKIAAVQADIKAPLVSPEKKADNPAVLPQPQQASREEKISIPAAAPQIMPKALIDKKQETKIAQKAPEPLLPLQKDALSPERNNYSIKNSSSVPENQVALLNKNIPVSGMAATAQVSAEVPQDTAKKWKTMAEKSPANDSPWVVAQSAGVNRNSLLKEEHFNKDKAAVDAALNNKPIGNSDYELLLASETVKNLLIPIPEDILNDEDLTPQLISPTSPEGIEKEAAIDAQIKRKQSKDGKKTAKKETPRPVPQEENITPITEPRTPGDKKKSILSSLSSIFQADEKSQKAAAASRAEQDGFIDNIKKKIRRSKGKIMPTEMRLSFQPNRAEISGQTLRWIQAFAARSANDKNLGIEIRIDGTSARELQQKRLTLLQNILISKGVPFSKINTVFTSREPNSFIIRTTPFGNNETGDKNKVNNRNGGTYLQW